MKHVLIQSICALIAVSLLLALPGVYVAGRALAEAQEVEIDYSTDREFLHIGNSFYWKPFGQYPNLAVTYTSDNTAVADISSEGMVTALKEGAVNLTASVPETASTKAEEHELYMMILSDEDGLYISDMTTHFYYQGKVYASGALPVETERQLCLTQPDMRVFLQDYLYPCQAKIADPTEAALTAIMNYGANYFRKVFRFQGVGGTAEDSKEDWMRMLATKNGLCEPCSSLFCYMMYLAGLPSMIVENPPSEHRAHDWNLIEHDGYYYNLENHVFLHWQYDKCVLPPFSEETAEYFAKSIIGPYFMHYPVKGGAFGSETKLNSMGRDLSEACPVMMCEKLPSGEYSVHFETIRADSLPTWADGTTLTMEEIRYRSMETGDGSDLNNQSNDEAGPLYEAATHMLYRQIVGLFGALRLSRSLTSIGSEAFSGVGAKYVIIPDGVTEIAPNAFADSGLAAIIGNTDSIRSYAAEHGYLCY